MWSLSVTIGASSVGCQKWIVLEMLVACVSRDKTTKQW